MARHQAPKQAEQAGRASLQIGANELQSLSSLSAALNYRWQDGQFTAEQVGVCLVQAFIRLIAGQELPGESGLIEAMARAHDPLRWQYYGASTEPKAVEFRENALSRMRDAFALVRIFCGAQQLGGEDAREVELHQAKTDSRALYAALGDLLDTIGMTGRDKEMSVCELLLSASEASAAIKNGFKELAQPYVAAST